MIELLKRLRRTWLIAARPEDADALPALIAEGVLIVGEHSYYHDNLKVMVWRSPAHGRMGGRIIVGRYCSIAGGVTLLTGGNHQTSFVSTYPFRAQWDMAGRDVDGQTTSNGDISIGHDVWIGEDATILSGVSVGHGAVIGAGSLVSRDVGPYSIIGGNPAREIRRRFTEDQIRELLAIAWWNWPEDLVRERVPMLNGGDIESFIEGARATGSMSQTRFT